MAAADKVAFDLSYTRQRTSPYASQLNPRNTSVDSLRVRVGNPYLRPYIDNVLTLNFTWNHRSLYLAPFFTYDYITNQIVRTICLSAGMRFMSMPTSTPIIRTGRFRLISIIRARHILRFPKSPLPRSRSSRWATACPRTGRYRPVCVILLPKTTITLPGRWATAMSLIQKPR